MDAIAIKVYGRMWLNFSLKLVQVSADVTVAQKYIFLLSSQMLIIKHNLHSSIVNSLILGKRKRLYMRINTFTHRNEEETLLRVCTYFWIVLLISKFINHSTLLKDTVERHISKNGTFKSQIQ